MLVSLLFLSSSLLLQTDAYAFGDIRLYLNDSSSLNNTQGVIEIFINDIWGTVCIQGFNKASAAAACRQLGFKNTQSFTTPAEYHFQVPQNLTPVITDVTCNDHDLDDLVTTGSLHILRCPSTIIGSGPVNCSPSNSVAIKCDPEAITKDPYDGQVRLVGEDSSVSSGLAEIYLNNEWGTVCYEGMTESAADSFCRQVGYTNSLSYMPVNSELDAPVWIDSTHCTRSRECFSTECIHIPKTPLNCANNSSDTSISCAYNINNEGVLSSGNIFECQLKSKNTLALIVGLSIGLIIAVGVVVTLCIIAALFICCTVETCPLYAYRNKRKYTGLI